MVNKYVKEFKELVSLHIKREGIEDLMAWLEQSDFYEAPASAYHQLACEGGLVESSVKTYKELVEQMRVHFGDEWEQVYDSETIAVVGLLHDVHKANTFEVEMRNKKIDGEWVQVPFYVRNPIFPLGKGEKSLFILQNFMSITPEEAVAIRWHEGAYIGDCNVARQELGLAYSEYPLALMLHVADLVSTYFVRGEEE